MAPAKYFTGLSPSEKKQRMKRIQEGRKSDSRDPRAYRPFKTDKNKKVKKSKYTAKFEAFYPNAKSLEQKSKATGVPLSIIKKVYDKGLGFNKLRMVNWMFRREKMPPCRKGGIFGRGQNL